MTDEEELVEIIRKITGSGWDLIDIPFKFTGLCRPYSPLVAYDLDSVFKTTVLVNRLAPVLRL
jgi:hypothetical protein